MAMSRTDEQKKPLFEEGLRGLVWDWYKKRVEQIHHRVSAYELLRRNGIRLKQVSDSRAEQIRCPFHGSDNKPSARVYPDSATRPSHVWCYVCQKSWDVIGLQMEFGSLKFSQALTELERSYGIETPEMPKDLHGKVETPPDESLVEFEKLYGVCERRLRYARDSYKALEDFKGYLSASTILDRVSHQVGDRKMAPERGIVVLQQLLSKITVKVQAGAAVLEGSSCPEG